MAATCRCLRVHFGIFVQIVYDLTFVVFRMKHVNIILFLPSVTLGIIAKLSVFLYVNVVKIYDVLCAVVKKVRTIM